MPVAGKQQDERPPARSDLQRASLRARQTTLWETWRKERMESLARPDGWLSLAGLFWLKPGDNGFGSDEKNPDDSWVRPVTSLTNVVTSRAVLWSTGDLGSAGTRGEYGVLNNA